MLSKAQGLLWRQVGICYPSRIASPLVKFWPQMGLQVNVIGGCKEQCSYWSIKDLASGI